MSDLEDLMAQRGTQAKHYKPDLMVIPCHVVIQWMAGHVRAVAEPSKEAPTNNGIKEADSLCAQYNAGDIDIDTLVCRLWNSALQVGRSESVALINKMMKHDAERVDPMGEFPVNLEELG